MLTKTRLRSALLGSGAAIALLVPSAAATAGEVDGLKDQIQALQDRLDRIEQDQAAIDERAYTIAPAMAVIGGDMPNSFKLPGSDTSMSISGFIRADFQYDFDMNSDTPRNDGTFLFSQIPLDGSADARRDGEFRFVSRNTGLTIATSTPSEFGEIATVLSIDFVSGTGNELTENGFIPELKEAYGTIGPLLVGQTVSTFADVTSYPTTVDWYNIVSGHFLLQTQVRYTQDLGDGLVVKLALENPDTAGIATQLAPGGTATQSSLTSITDNDAFNGPDSWPDAVIKFDYDDSWGHLGVGGVLRSLQVDNGAGVQDSGIGWGTTVGLSASTFGDDFLTAHFTYGEGVARYFFGGYNDVQVFNFANGALTDLDPVTTWGWHVGYHHAWTDSIASNAAFAWVHTDLDANALYGPGTNRPSSFRTNEDLQSIHVNTFWYPVDQVSIGLEYIRGMRHTFAGDYATANKVQLGFWYSF